MKSVQDISKSLAEHRQMLDSYGIENLWVFGSVVAGCAAPNDLDILVEFRVSPSLVEYLELRDALTEILGIEVDLVSRKGCKSAFLSEIESDLRHVA